jgi:long-chain acyl-CoA synthetase
MTPTRVFDLLYNQLRSCSQEISLSEKVDGKYKGYSTKEFVSETISIAKGLWKIGIQKDDKIALISWNCPQWLFVDFGIQQVGAVSVPMYPTITEKDYAYILNDADVKLIVVQNEELFTKVREAQFINKSQIPIYSIDKIEGLPNLNDLKSQGVDIDITSIEERKKEVLPDDLFTLIYTSGTTGNPKGVMVTHKGLIEASQSVDEVLSLSKEHKSLSFLPLCHVFERSMAIIYIMKGMSIYYAESMETIGDNLKEVKPHMFVTVPRLLEKVYDKIYAKGLALTGVKKLLFFWALDLGQRYEFNKEMGFWYNQKLKLANILIFSKWREALGGNVKLIVTGGAAMQPRLLKIFNAAQIMVREGYGMTEAPIISCNRPNHVDIKIGTVGPLMNCAEVQIADNGEILVRGNLLMKGYYKQPEKTQEAIRDGWFHTGDIGTYEKGYLKITGRVKEIFKTSGGKYIAPDALENKFKESKVIEQIMVVGENQKFASALIVPNFEGLKEWCKIKEINYSTNNQMIREQMVIDKFDKERERYNSHFAQYEQIKKFKLLAELWTVESEELTPTMKCKRKVIFSNNEDLINSIYNC